MHCPRSDLLLILLILLVLVTLGVAIGCGTGSDGGGDAGYRWQGEDTRRPSDDAPAEADTIPGVDTTPLDLPGSDVICAPGTPGGECASASEVWICNGAGTAYHAQACPPGNTCFSGACVDWKCAPGDRICKGVSAVQECLQDQGGDWSWQVVEDCASGLCMDGTCVGACDSDIKLNTYLGCNYYAVDLDNIEGGMAEPVGVVVSAPGGGDPAEISFTDSGTGAVLTSAELGGAPLLVEPGGLQVYLLPTGKDIDGSGVSKLSVRIDATTPVTVHQFNPLQGADIFTNDASLLLPAHAGGDEYLVMSWKLRTWVETLRGFATVVATQPGATTVQVKASAPIVAGPGVGQMAKGATQGFVLQQGEVLNLEVDGIEGDDLTGTQITADKQISVFGGHECANVQVSYERCDHIEQQLFPLQAWGTHYVGDPFFPRNGAHVDTWRILGGEANVSVQLDPPVAGPFVLGKGQFVEFDTQVPFEATGSGKFLVGHFLQSCNYPGHTDTCSDASGPLGIGDPAFTLGVPVGQYLDEYVLLTPEGYDQDYINFIYAAGTAITLDGVPLSGAEIPVGNVGMRLIQEAVSPGVHAVVADAPVGLTAYGYGCHVSYAYPGGLSLEVF